MKKIITIFSLLSFFTSCSYDKGDVPKPIQACVTDPVIHTVQVTIADYSFTPSNITIVAGDTVKWTNTGAMQHTVTCNGAPSGASMFDSGVAAPINSGGIYKIAIPVPGNYTYVCSFHSQMTGTIVVKPRCK